MVSVLMNICYLLWEVVQFCKTVLHAGSSSCNCEETKMFACWFGCKLQLAGVCIWKNYSFSLQLLTLELNDQLEVMLSYTFKSLGRNNSFSHINSGTLIVVIQEEDIMDFNGRIIVLVLSVKYCLTDTSSKFFLYSLCPSSLLIYFQCLLYCKTPVLSNPEYHFLHLNYFSAHKEFISSNFSYSF